MRDFNHTVNILVQAFLKGTLQHMNCHACAVGNLVAHARNIELENRGGDIIWKGGSNPVWYNVLCCGVVNYESKSFPVSKLQAESTGYTIEEIARIEMEFELQTDCGNTTDPDGYKGLMAVVDVLADIHGIDLKAKEEAKALFVKA